MSLVNQLYGHRDTRSARCTSWAYGLIATLIALTSPILGAFGSEHAPTLADYQHTTWTERDGVPPIIAVMAQTNDGWLWFGSPSGLYRFDGIRFERVEIDVRDTMRSPGVSMLYALASGGLAIGTQEDGVVFLKDGRFTRDDDSTTRKAGYIMDLAQDLDGGLWATAADGLLHFDGHDWTSVGGDRGYPGGASTAVVDSDGTLWLLVTNGVVRLPRGQRKFESISVKANGYADLLQLQDGTMWLYDPKGIVQKLPGKIVKTRDPADTRRRSAAEVLDRSGRLWAMEETGSGSLSRPVLSYKSITKNANGALEDRQGNIWVCGVDGTVHRFHRSSILTLLARPASQSPLNAAFVVDEPGRVWMALTPDFSREDAEGVYLFDGTLHRVQAEEIRSASAIARQVDGTLWVGGRDGLWRREHDRFERAVALPDEARGALVRGIAPDCAGGLWVVVPILGLIRYDGARWQANGGFDNLPVASSPSVLTCDAVGRLWLGYADGRVARIENQHVVTFDAASGLSVGAVTSLHVGPTQTLVAGERGLAVLRGDDRFVSLNVADAVAVERATGIAETVRGDLWLNNLHGIAHLLAVDLGRSESAPNEPIAVEKFDAVDGYPSPGFSFAVSQPSIAVTGEGQILFAGNAGISSIDPAQIDRSSDEASPAVIRSVTSNGVHRALTDLARLPEDTRDLEVDYTSLDYSHPERLRFRYRLDGVQKQWVDAGARREAFYTNLGPGNYRFVVDASGANGLWSDRSATLDFVIPPTFLQSRLFLALCIAATLALLALAYRLRVRTVRLRERQFVENRLRERERIARELHDTLLQGTQGLIFSVQAVANEVSIDDPLRARLEKSLTRANEVMAEGRDRIQELRGAEEAFDDLPRALALLGEELAQEGASRFEATVSGEPRVLVPAIASEVMRIVREALLNAFRHAEAESVELDLVYADDAFVVRIRDNGQGFDIVASNSGVRREHWGLPGMRERAQRIQATLTIWSRVSAGTKIDLTVPAANAYPRR